MRFLVAALVAALIVPGAAFCAPDVQTFRGHLAAITVGGVETPARPAIQIGDDRFEAVGQYALLTTMRGLVGEDVEITGTVENRMSIGGEGYPLLTVLSVKRLLNTTRAMTFTGTLRAITVGGIETPTRPAIQIGNDRFEVAGDPALIASLREQVGHRITVTGTVENRMYIGGEGFPVLTITSVKRAE